MSLKPYFECTCLESTDVINGSFRGINKTVNILYIVQSTRLPRAIRNKQKM